MPSKYYIRRFTKGYFYHIYNRGANKEKVFLDNEDYNVFVHILGYYLQFPLGKPLSVFDKLVNKVPNLDDETIIESTVKLCAYCIMPNHFHLLIKQHTEPTKTNSVTNLMRRLTITYAMYFKDKYDHSGTIFQGKFKNITVESDAQLVQLSKYIHRNPIENQGSEPVLNYKYSSYPYYVDSLYKPDWLDINEILGLFSQNIPKYNYQKFVEEIPIQKLHSDATLE